MVSLATLGKFWPQAGYGLAANKGIGGEGGGVTITERERKPVVVVDRLREKNEKITVTVIGVIEW